MCVHLDLGVQAAGVCLRTWPWGADKHSLAVPSSADMSSICSVSRRVPGAYDPPNKRDGRVVFRVAIPEGAREGKR